MCDEMCDSGFVNSLHNESGCDVMSTNIFFYGGHIILVERFHVLLFTLQGIV